jgi:hypothetical protein
MRGPFSDILLDGRTGRVADAAGGPIGIVKAAGFVMAVTLVLISFFAGFEALLGEMVPSFDLVPLEILAFAVVAIGGSVGIFRLMTRRRRGY